MDSYQPIYDAVRSKIGNGDIGRAVEQAMRPKIFIDGNQWCALYGDNLHEGVAGFGDSPAKAMWDFDRAWNKDLPHNNELDGLPTKGDRHGKHEGQTGED